MNASGCASQVLEAALGTEVARAASQAGQVPPCKPLRVPPSSQSAAPAPAWLGTRGMALFLWYCSDALVRPFFKSDLIKGLVAP